jgi:hypothetical protein
MIYLHAYSKVIPLEVLKILKTHLFRKAVLEVTIARDQRQHAEFLE